MWPFTSSNVPKLGMIAGSGDYPLILAEALRANNRDTVVIGVDGITKREIGQIIKDTRYVGWGEVEKLVGILKETGVKELIFAGGLPKKDILDFSKPVDETTRQIIGKKGNRGDDHLLRAFQLFFRVRCGARVIDSRSFLKDTLALKGVMTQCQPTPQEWADLQFGYQVAKQIGRTDIGQTVVVKEGVVIAVEAIEGTDETIRRSTGLCGPGAVVMKATKPGQELKFDLPCVGLQTIGSLKLAGIKALGLEAGKTLMLKRELILKEADAAGISIVGL